MAGDRALGKIRLERGARRGDGAEWRGGGGGGGVDDTVVQAPPGTADQDFGGKEQPASGQMLKSQQDLLGVGLRVERVKKSQVSLA